MVFKERVRLLGQIISSPTSVPLPSSMLELLFRSLHPIIQRACPRKPVRPPLSSLPDPANPSRSQSHPSPLPSPSSQPPSSLALDRPLQTARSVLRRDLRYPGGGDRMHPPHWRPDRRLEAPRVCRAGQAQSSVPSRGRF